MFDPAKFELVQTVARRFKGAGGDAMELGALAAGEESPR